MTELLKSFFILCALGGMIFSCSGHRVMEEKSFEIEETELEDLLTRNEESERKIRQHELSPANRQIRQLTDRPGIRKINHSRQDLLRERDRHNGIGAFLLI